MIKAILKILVFFLIILLAGYFAIVYSEGGYGKKEPVHLSLKDNPVPLLFAHRGVVGKYPENSMEAIELAKKYGFKGLEIDIRKTSDNTLILFHDENAKRLLGIDTTIASMTYDQIRQHDLLIGEDTSTSRVPALDQVIMSYKEDFIYYFDMKLGSITAVDELIHLIWANDIPKRVIVASPSFLVILYIEYHYPAINTAMEGFNSGNEWAWSLIPKNLKPDFLSGFAAKVDEKHVEWLKEKDLHQTRIVYGVDSTNYMQMQNLGISNMIIDYFPSLLIP